jgi:DNA-binding Lrp family transcriptional regulator
MTRTVDLDSTDRRIINALQGGFPVSPRPYADAAKPLGLSEQDLLARLNKLVESGALSRFGPMYNSEAMGGAVTLAAIRVPPDRFDEVAATVNAHREVAHNYQREHRLNMWFVIAAESAHGIDEVITRIESETGLEVFNMPKREEFFIGLKVEV